MAYQVSEIETAVLEINNKNNLCLSTETACSIADKIVEKLDRMGFIDARRYALNETMVRRHYKTYDVYRAVRKGYNSVMGKVFGAHANKKRAAKRAREKQRAAEKALEDQAKARFSRPGPVIIEGKKGQLRFLV